MATGTCYFWRDFQTHLSSINADRSRDKYRLREGIRANILEAEWHDDKTRKQMLIMGQYYEKDVLEIHKAKLELTIDSSSEEIAAVKAHIPIMVKEWMTGPRLTSDAQFELIADDLLRSSMSTPKQLADEVEMCLILCELKGEKVRAFIEKAEKEMERAKDDMKQVTNAGQRTEKTEEELEDAAAKSARMRSLLQALRM